MSSALATIALLAAGTVLLAASAPPVQRDPAASNVSAALATRASRRLQGTAGAGRTVLVLAPGAAHTARVFLAGYLAYLYGRARATAVRDATPMLARSLQTHPPLLSPAVRARHPRVLSLHLTARRAGLLRVGALVNDGELASYPIRLILSRRDGRLLVSAVGGAS